MNQGSSSARQSENAPPATPPAGLPSAAAPKSHLSWSQVNTFLMCGRRYWYERRARVKTITSSALFFGSRCHDAEEFNYRQKIQTDTDLPSKDVEDFFMYVFEREFGKEEIELGPGESQESLKGMGRGVIAKHMKTIAPDIHPLYVEYPPRAGDSTQRISLGDNFPFNLQAHLDIVERDPKNPERPFGFSDHKHYASRKFNGIENDIDADDQYTMYALVYRLLFGEVERSIHSNIVTKEAKPRARRVATERTEKQIRFLLGTIEDVGRQIEAGIFTPHTNGWWCSEKWCGFWDACQNQQTWRQPHLHYPHLESK